MFFKLLMSNENKELKNQLNKALEKNRRLHSKYVSLRDIAANETNSKDYTTVKCKSCHLWYKQPPWYIEETHTFQCCIETNYCNNCVGDSVYDCHVPLYICPKCEKCEPCEECGFVPENDF